MVCTCKLVLLMLPLMNILCKYNVTKSVTFITETPYLHNCYPHLAKNRKISYRNFNISIFNRLLHGAIQIYLGINLWRRRTVWNTEATGKCFLIKWLHQGLITVGHIITLILTDIVVLFKCYKSTWPRLTLYKQPSFTLINSGISEMSATIRCNHHYFTLNALQRMFLKTWKLGIIKSFSFVYRMTV